MSEAAQQPRKGFTSIQCMRGIAALLVLSCHIGSIQALYMGMRFFPEFGKNGVDLFFVISGFVMAYISRDKWGKASALAPFMFKRIFRIYPVYWEFTAVIIGIMLLKPAMMNMGDAAQVSIIKSLLLWPQATDPLLGAGWTLVFEMYFYLLFCIAFLVPRKWVPVAFMSWAGVLLLVRITGIGSSHSSGGIWLITSPLAFEFMVGCALAYLYLRNVKVNPLALSIAAVVWCVTVNIYCDTQLPAWHVIGWGVPSALLLYAAIMLEAAKPLSMPKWLQSVGDVSYSLYLCHSLIISALGKLWLHLPVQGMLSNMLFVAASIALPLTVSFLNYRYFELPVSRWAHRKVARTAL